MFYENWPIYKLLRHHHVKQIISIYFFDLDAIKTQLWFFLMMMLEYKDILLTHFLRIHKG